VSRIAIRIVQAIPPTLSAALVIAASVALIVVLAGMPT
jgi:hypothetical protein